MRKSLTIYFKARVCVGAINDFKEFFRDANIVWKLLIVILHGTFVKMINVHVKGYIHDNILIGTLLSKVKVGEGRLFLMGYSA